MKTIASSLDMLLYAMVALTVALIVYKVIDLWLPRLLGRKPFALRVHAGSDEVSDEIERLEGGMAFVAVIASAAPFVGLAGTVLHIMEALRGMGLNADMMLISGPIATALNSTLVGLASAIPAAAAYSLMQRRLQVLQNRFFRRLG